MQAKHSEAMEELKKICLIHQIFPPEPSSVCLLTNLNFIVALSKNFWTSNKSSFVNERIINLYSSAVFFESPIFMEIEICYLVFGL